MCKIIKRLKTPEEVEQYFPGFMAFIYCTEQQIHRPKNKRKRKLYYSLGKKKKYTVKNLYMANKDEIILYKTKHKQVGKRHDYKVYKKNYPAAPKDVESILDLGVLGVEEKDYSEQISSLPIKKKKRNQELALEEKECNRIHSKKRIVIYHFTCVLKLSLANSFSY